MPKKAISPHETMDRALLVALAAGQARVGDKNTDTARYMPHSQTVFYSRLKNPGTFSLDELRILAEKYGWTDYQVCKILGVNYNGQTLRQEAI